MKLKEKIEKIHLEKRGISLIMKKIVVFNLVLD